MITDNLVTPIYNDKSQEFNKVAADILLTAKLDEFDVVKNLQMLKKTLIKEKKWSEYEKDFVNFALANCIHYIDSAKTKENYIKIYNDVKNKMFYLDLSGHDRSYFYDKKLYSRLVSVIEKDAIQQWDKKNKTEEEYSFLNLDEWNRPEIPETPGVKVSVVIPAYNVEKYIRECLDSLVNQTLKDIEIICVNDGSTDSTLQIMEEFAEKDKRVIVKSQENRGISVARNNAIENAKGEYILFVDSDDYIELRAIEYLYYEAKSKNLDQLYFSTNVFYDISNNEIDKNLYIRKNDYSSVRSGKQFFIDTVQNGEFKPTPVLYITKLELLNKNNIEFKKGIIHEDNLFTIQCLYYAERVAFHNINLYHRRVRENSIMTNGQNIRHAYCYYCVIKELEKLLEKNDNPDDKEYAEALLTQMERMMINAEKYLEGKDLDYLLQNVKDIDFEFVNRMNLLINQRRKVTEMHDRAVAAEQKITLIKFNDECKIRGYEKNREKLENEYKQLEEERNQLKKIRTSLMKEGGNTMPKVSIIIPTFNVEDYLVECMESITNQTLKDIEIICINDGSTDGSLEILRRYEQIDPRIILVDKENGGYGIGMNIGLEKATGEYIGILEPDDYVPINMYEDLYHIAKENELDFVKADFYRFTRDDDESMNLVYNHLSKNKNDYNKVFNPSETPNAIRYIMNTWSGIYRRDFLNEHNIRHNETPGASFQDNGFWFQTFVYGKRAMIVDKPYYRNRRDNPNSSVKNPQKVYCMNVEYDHIRNILMKDEELWDRFKYMYSLKKWHNYNSTLNRISEEFKREYVDRISEEFKRAQVKQELDESLFTAKEWEKVTLLMNSPQGFYNTYVVKNATNAALKKELKKTKSELKKTKSEVQKAKAQVKATKSSITFKVGRIIMFIPFHIKKLLKK